MPVSRISVPLDRCELDALLNMAAADCRHPREQMRYLLREEARRRGLLAADRNADNDRREVESEEDDNSAE